MIKDTLYKRTSTGAVQIWCQEIEGDKYRTISGQIDGAKVESAWTVAQPTNVGRSNERDGVAQAIFEVEANYKKKLEQGGYHADIKDIDKPKFFKVMLAKSFDDYKKGPFPTCYIYSQPKLDGMRGHGNHDGLLSRNGKTVNMIPHIGQALAPVAEGEHWFDGELYNHELKADFNKLMSLLKRKAPSEAEIRKNPGDYAAHLQRTEDLVQYHMYDLPSHPGTFSERNAALKAILEELNDDALAYVRTDLVTSWEHLDALYEEYMEQGYEGQMVRFDEPYEQKRSKFLLKRKEFDTTDFVISDIKDGIGNWAGCAKSIEFIMPNDHRKANGERPDSGMRGTMEEMAEVFRNRDKYIGKIATIRHFRYTPDGVPRFPVVIELDRQDI